MRTMRRAGRGNATPVHTAVPVPGAPPIATMRIDSEHARRVAPGSHTHDFPTLAFFERGTPGGGDPAAGDLYVIAPGDVLTVEDPVALAVAGGWGVHFLPEALDDVAPGALLSWRAHPLLCTFARDAASGVLRLSVPEAERTAWAARIRALDTELRERRDGHHEAALAHLVLLLVAVARLARDAVAARPRRDEPLLGEVFAIIERRYPGPLSLRDVARELNLSAGHLTTTVRRRTGRTVGDWIVERRMAQARRLLVESSLSVEEVGRAVGLPDPSYFARQFRRAHGIGPRAWRQGGRGAAQLGGAAGRSGS